MVSSAIFVWPGLTVLLSYPAKTFEEVQGAVAELVKDRILIGHAIQNDLKVCTLLQVTCPWCISCMTPLSPGTLALTSSGANSGHATSSSSAWPKPLCSTRSEEPGT